LLLVVVHILCSAAAIALTRLPDDAPRSATLAPTLTAIWIAQWLASIAVLALCAHAPLRQSLDLTTGIAAILAGMVACIHHFGWYLLVAFVWGGHVNEAGAALKWQGYKEWIRFHLGADGVLTGYVIGVDTAVDPRKHVPVAHVVDVFQMKR